MWEEILKRERAMWGGGRGCCRQGRREPFTVFLVPTHAWQSFPGECNRTSEDRSLKLGRNSFKFVGLFFCVCCGSKKVNYFRVGRETELGLML